MRNIHNFNKFNMNESHISEEEKLINRILDKISDVGYNNISSVEKEILAKKSRGESLDDYIEKDDPKITYDNKGMLFNGLTYEEWQNQEKEKEKESGGFKKTSRISTGGSFDGNYKVRLYIEYGSPQRYYYIFHKDGKKQKYRTVGKDESDIFGTKSTLSSWPNDSMDEVHKKIEKEYDAFKDLTPEETSDFETLLTLRERWRMKEFDDNSKESKNMLRELARLHKKFSKL